MDQNLEVPKLGTSNDEKPFQPGDLIWFEYYNQILVVLRNGGDGWGVVRNTDPPYDRRDNFRFSGACVTRRIL